MFGHNILWALTLDKTIFGEILIAETFFSRMMAATPDISDQEIQNN
jgi:hypothetical protein